MQIGIYILISKGPKFVVFNLFGRIIGLMSKRQVVETFLSIGAGTRKHSWNQESCILFGRNLLNSMELLKEYESWGGKL